jgi:methylphosphotriester-DNA--protein-cysteine methyltransferase
MKKSLSDRKKEWAFRKIKGLTPKEAKSARRTTFLILGR